MGLTFFRGHEGGDLSHGTSDSVAVPANGGAISLPTASFISDGHFVRAGSDLVLSDTTGHELVVHGYFAAPVAPDLVSPDGSQVLTPNLVDSFLTPMAPGQYAQAAPTAVSPPIGQVLDLAGEAFAVHADGTRFPLAKGDAVYEGDIVETGGAGSAIHMVFTDKTEFSLGADARLALDQLVFNPDSQSGSSQFSVLKGVFIFASGEIAKTDNTHMTVITPVATIGIRGTEVAGHVSAADSQFTIIHGVIEVTTQAGSVTLDDHGETTHVTSAAMPPSSPVVLDTAQFDHAYGDVAGVVSNYFGTTHPDSPSPAPGGNGGPVPDGAHPNSSPSGHGDHTDAGFGPGATMLASALPSDTADHASLASALATDPLAASTAAFFDMSSASGLIDGATATGDQSNVAVAGLFIGPAAGGDTSGAGSSGGGETVLAPVPGIDFTGGLTFSGPTAAPGGNAGFTLTPTDLAATPAPGVSAPEGAVQVAFTPAVTGIGDGSTGLADAGHAATDGTALNVPSTVSSGSPFRSDSGASDPFASNPYITHPFGYTGPQVGDPIFHLVADGSNGAGDGANASGSTSDWGSDGPITISASQSPDQSSTQESHSDPANITLIVSNATTNETYQDLTHHFELPNTGPGQASDIDGSQMGIPGVPDTASIHLARDAGGNVDVALTSAWDSVKNIKAESATAADITIKNFVHADVTFGDGGDSHITIDGAKRGFITTGNGNDTIAINAYSNGVGWSNSFNVHTGAGNDVLTFNGASNGVTQLTFDGGDGTDTLKLSGAGQSFSLGAGQIQISNVERVDISGAGNTTLNISSSLYGSSDTNTSRTLIVDGDAGDTVHLQGGGWHQDGTTPVDGQSYTVYTSQDHPNVHVAAAAGVAVT